MATGTVNGSTTPRDMGSFPRRTRARICLCSTTRRSRVTGLQVTQRGRKVEFDPRRAKRARGEERRSAERV